MATIRKEIVVDASAAEVWAALRDVGEVHRRVARELIVDVDDKTRRLAYSARSERLQHHNASVQVFENGSACRVVWIADVLPHAAAAAVGAMMEEGAAVMSKTLAEHSKAA